MTRQVKPRGRPRSLAAKQAILRAARELLDADGPGAVTIEAVAGRSGVSKPTIYRWWPNRHAVTMAALMESDAPASPTGANAIAALRAQLRAIAARFASSTGRHVASIIAAADSETEIAKAFRNFFVLARRDEGKALLARAIADGVLRRGINIDVALDLLYGPLFFRLLMGHAPLDGAFINALLSHALKGLEAQNGRAR